MAKIINYLKEKNYLNTVILFLIVFVLYGNTLNNKYSLDDNFVVENNENIQKGISGIPKLFIERYSTKEDKKFGYRPIVLTSFAIEYSFFGKNTTINHFINVLLYFLISLVLLKLLNYFFRDYNKYFIWAILLLFIAHPVHTEVVASLKNRDELLSFLFGLLSVSFTIKFVNKQKIINLIFASLLFILAYLSKQSAVVFVIITPLSIYFFTKSKIKNIILIFIIFFILLNITQRVPKYFLEHSYRVNQFIENPLNKDNSFFQRIMYAIYSSVFYLKLVLFPRNLSFYYGYNTIPIDSIFNIKSIISIIIHLFLFIYAIIKIPTKHPISYGIFFYLISISIFLNIIRPIMGIVADRYLFSAIFGFSIILVYLIFKLFNINIKTQNLELKYIKKPIYLVSLLIIIYSFKTINRNNDWYDRLTLFEADINHLKNSAKANELIANLYYINALKYKKLKDNNNYFKNIKRSIRYYKQALSIYPQNKSSLIQLSLSNLFLSLNIPDSALFYLTKVDTISNSEYLFNIAQQYEALKNYDSSIVFYKRTLLYDSLNEGALTKLSMLLNHVNKKDEAIIINKEFANKIKNYETPLINIANLYYINGDTLKAIKYAEDAIKINPDNKNTIALVYNYYLSKGNVDKIEYYSKLINYSDINK